LRGTEAKKQGGRDERKARGFTAEALRALREARREKQGVKLEPGGPPFDFAQDKQTRPYK